MVLVQDDTSIPTPIQLGRELGFADLQRNREILIVIQEKRNGFPVIIGMELSS